MTVRKLLFAVSLLFFATGPHADAADVLDFVETERQASTDIADTLWRLAELGYLEQNSSSTLQNYLAEREFTIEQGVADIPTAFVAKYGRGGPTIALLAEFDALPGLNQRQYQRVWRKKKAPPVMPVATTCLVQRPLRRQARWLPGSTRTA